MKRAILALAVALSVAGCGAIRNTIIPQPGTADQLTVALNGQPGPSDVGIYAARADGFFHQADLDVKLEPPSHATPLQDLESGRAQIAILDEPTVLLARNAFHPVVAIAGIVQGSSTTGIVCAAATVSHHHTAKPSCTPKREPGPAQYATAPTYNGLVFAVTETTIVNHSAILRRFIQAVARGYDRTQRDPGLATSQLSPAVPQHWTHAVLRSAVEQAMGSFFFPGHGWGWMSPKQWNAFGDYLARRHQLTNPNAIPGAETNQLLAGQGI